MRLKDVAVVNRCALSEATDPDRVFTYVDIGCVDDAGTVTGAEQVQFADAPSRARRLVEPGDSIISTVRTYLRAIAFIDADASEFVVSTGFATLSPRPGVHPRFLYWTLRSSTFIEDVVARSVGVGYPAITATELATLPVTLPPFDVQQQTADYLDAETSRIDSLISEQQGQLRFLEEHRHALISEAVRARVGGHSSTLEDALGSLPAGWKVVPLRFIAKVQSGVTLGKTYEGPLEERPYLRVANVQDGSLDLDDVTTIWVPRDVAGRCQLRDGDVLMTEGGDNDKLGRGAVWGGEIPGCLHQNHIFAVRPDQERLRSDYLALVMGSSWGRGYFTATAHQTTNLATTNRSKVGGFPVPLPPLNEQDELLRRLHDQFAELDELSSEFQLQIALLREHRQALVTAAVADGRRFLGAA